MKQIVLIGGSGFIGSHLAAQLAAQGHRIIIPTRRPEAARQTVLPNVELRRANVADPQQLAALLAGADVAVNLVGILQGSEADFERAHVTLTARIIAACQAAGVRRYLHMSALGADSAGPSRYQRSKGRAEELVRASPLRWTIYRPSVVFGRGDSFITLFAGLCRLPLIPLAGAHAQFQPVWVEDVARAFAAGVTRDDLIGATLNLVGPDIMTLADIVRLAGRTVGRPPVIVPLPDWLARLQASLMAIMPNPPVSHDNLDSMTIPNTDPAGFPATLGWIPASLAVIAPGYLRGSHYDEYRRHAGRGRERLHP
ncbi:NADH dehydrogenase [Andreprevotia lacus DSM 23236]|jgi:NADH dehydrogenase|uniref:NADH dehydrogenase n=1 Tax=Andreprevotia lacus DSM 23236 TaxID=1121001 RepID=A0A1W1XS93_9NEIS|nr:complex I NDUFA9 subunit family protein [Andreprevotia lacus]SMC26839.1 NADH dehydrogenase [Andreprevotia lacus DSM 23236]